MRVLVDTNVLISAVLFGGTPRRVLVRAIRGEIDLVTSPFLLDEMEAVLVEKLEFNRAAARATRAEVEAIADVIESVDVPRVCRDPDDDEVLAAAVAGSVELIVTGDRDSLALKAYQQIQILTPRESGLD